MKRILVNLSLVAALWFLPGIPLAHAMAFEEWQALVFTPEELAESGVSGSAADPDGDGRNNSLEFAADTDPKTVDGFATPEAAFDAAGHLTLTFTRRQQAAGFLYIPQVSGDLLRWQSGPQHVASVSVAPRDAQSDFVTVRDLLSADVGGSRFIRLMVAGDGDGDGLPDSWELLHGLSPFDPTDGYADFDNDGVSNADEFANGTDPLAEPIPPPGPTPPAAPSDVRVMTDPDGGRHIYWLSNSDNETYFVIRDYLPDGSVIELGRVGPGQTELYLPPAK